MSKKKNIHTTIVLVSVIILLVLFAVIYLYQESNRKNYEIDRMGTSLGTIDVSYLQPKADKEIALEETKVAVEIAFDDPNVRSYLETFIMNDWIIEVASDRARYFLNAYKESTVILENDTPLALTMVLKKTH